VTTLDSLGDCSESEAHFIPPFPSQPKKSKDVLVMQHGWKLDELDSPTTLNHFLSLLLISI
jgi:hypothetical protein